MGMDVGGKSGGSMATPHVVPLIDIMLVLIIISWLTHAAYSQGPGYPPRSLSPSPKTSSRRRA